MKLLNHFWVVVLLSLMSANELWAQERLPALELKNTKGETVQVESYGKKEKVVVLSFWATWCVPCRKELDNISGLYDEWQEKYNVELVAISVDDQRTLSRVPSYVAGKGWEYEVLLDSKEELKRALNGLEVPYTVVLNKKGEIVYKHAGYTEGDEFELEKKIAELVAE